jgi:transglutaminase-like putative cysteine protease
MRRARANSPSAGIVVSTQVTLNAAAGPALLYLPLAQAAAYQSVLGTDWHGTGQAAILHDPRYGAPMLRCSWDEATPVRQITLVQQIATARDHILTPLPHLPAAERALWTAPTPSVPTDGIVLETAQSIVAGHTTPRDRARAIYDWVVENTFRDPQTRGCGTGDVVTMLRARKFGGKCADINGLAVALARAAGLPARDVYGIRVGDAKVFPALGKSGDISKTQHCRAEIFLDGEGWLPIDPADVRKVVLEGKLPLDDPAVAKIRDLLFGAWEMNWIGYNSANDIELPGDGGRQPNFPFLMYPTAFTAAGQPDSLDPAAFSYRISSRPS